MNQTKTVVIGTVFLNGLRVYTYVHICMYTMMYGVGWGCGSGCGGSDSVGCHDSTWDFNLSRVNSSHLSILLSGVEHILISG